MELREAEREAFACVSGRGILRSLVESPESSDVLKEIGFFYYATSLFSPPPHSSSSQPFGAFISLNQGAQHKFLKRNSHMMHVGAMNPK